MHNTAKGYFRFLNCMDDGVVAFASSVGKRNRDGCIAWADRKRARYQTLSVYEAEGRRERESLCSESAIWE